ncbi:glycosyltransferase family 57 protein [Daedaleopsis nitida]|nr:glycosyltransferase family 57 protein [Daedaleopsis nitida]
MWHWQRDCSLQYAAVLDLCILLCSAGPLDIRPGLAPMSQSRSSPVATRPISTVGTGEKLHAVPDFIPEENATASKDSNETAPVPSSGRFSWLKLDMTKTEWDILVASTCLKLLLFPAYRSTDFEVHRNWLAITHSLPLSKWYYDTTSEWTLDYPPFFAYFEKLLSIPAYFVDPRIVDLNNLNYGAWSVVAYQRSTVIFTELVLGIAVLKFARGAENPAMQRIISASLFLHPGFLIVDHIHFQYNGFMFGILLWSILMARNDRKLASGFLFAVLLNFKHIYLYLAPAYFVYLLRSYCLSPTYALLPGRFLSLANAVILTFLVSLGPFLLMGQLPQLLSRLFPFTRGLNHAYWAPNFWALLTALDRVLLKVVSRGQFAGLSVNESGVASTSRGLVGDTVFAVLPTVKPIHTFAITVAFQTIYMGKLWTNTSYKSFVTALTLCGFTSYMFGWHVHEKAILLVLVPLSLLAAESNAYFRTFTIASVAGIYSLFPLLFTPAETLVKIVYSVLWVVFVLRPIHRQVYQFPTTILDVAIDILERFYLAGFPLLQVFVMIFPLLTKRRVATDSGMSEHADNSGSEPSALEFLPLMLTSVYCAIGLVWAFVRLSVLYLVRRD